MIILRRIKSPRLRDFRDYGPGKFLSRLGFGLFRGLALRLGVVKNRRSILRPAIRALAVQRGRIMRLPENRQDLLQARLLRVGHYPRKLGLARFTRAKFG